MKQKIKYRTMQSGEEEHIYDLVMKEFHRHVALHYSKKGIEKFISMFSPEWLRKQGTGNDSFVIVSLQGKNIVGMAAVINKSHIALIFVDSKFQKKGIGKKLINEATKKCLEDNPSLNKITVSSSPNSISFYYSLGFQTQGQEVNEDGMRFTPMGKKILQLKD